MVKLSIYVEKINKRYMYMYLWSYAGIQAITHNDKLSHFNNPNVGESITDVHLAAWKILLNDNEIDYEKLMKFGLCTYISESPVPAPVQPVKKKKKVIKKVVKKKK